MLTPSIPGDEAAGARTDRLPPPSAGKDAPTDPIAAERGDLPVGFLGKSPEICSIIPAGVWVVRN